MSVHIARLEERDPDTGEPLTFYFASTDAVDSDLFLPVNRPGTDDDEAEIAALFDVQPASKAGATGKTSGGGILYMRLHRRWLEEQGAEFLR